MTELESHLSVDASADNIARASQYAFHIGVFASADNTNWTDITALTTQIGPIWYGPIADNVYGWSFQISGMQYNSALLSPGCYVRLSKATTTLEESDYVESWMKGRILPSPVQFAHMAALWTIQVVDDITYLSRKKAPVFSVGTQNIALNASVTSDSDVDSTLVAGEGEFYGTPPLTADQAVDGDLNSLWISTKAPDPAETKSYFPYSDLWGDGSMILNEFYYKGYSPTSIQDQWFEIVSAIPDPPGTFRMLTRSGAIELSDVTVGRPTNLPGAYAPELNSKVAYYGIVTYDAGRHSQLWGEQTDVPVSEFKNAQYQFTGSIEPDAFGFNADGQGDFLAISVGGTITNGAWRVFAVVDGPKMRRFDKGWFDTPVNVTGGAFVISTSTSWGANELVGAFIRNTTDFEGWEYNCCRRILTNTASVASAYHVGYYDTTVTVVSGWANTATGGESNIPEPGHTLIIRPWPEYKWASGGQSGWFREGYGWYWSEANSTNYADYHMLADTGAGSTWRKSRDGWWKTYNGEDPDGEQIWDWSAHNTWILDRTPSPGPSSGYAEDPSGENDQAVDKYFPWIKITPPRISVVTAAPVNDGNTKIVVQSTDGLFQSYPDLVIPDNIREILVAGTTTEVRYTNKTATEIELEDPWDQGFVDIGTAIYQFEDGDSTDVWPIQFITLKRRRVPAQNATVDWRLIRKAHVFVSYQDSPLGPDDEEWRESWDSASNPTNPDGVPIFTVSGNSLQDTITFQVLNGGTFNFTRNYTRPKHLLVSIRLMTDKSRGRINELQLIPPQDTVQGLQNSTVAEFFSYVLQVLGIPLANIQIGDASTELLGTFSTDTSTYTDVLSDLATRTGQIVWSGPNLQARVQNHPNWPSSPVMTSWLTIDNHSASNLVVMPYTGYPISQLQVTVRDSDGNTAVGVYPSLPSSVGEILVEPVVRTADITQANSIARMLYNEISLAKLKATIVGPAPWARPGAYRVDLNYTLPNGTLVTGPYYISNIDHQISLGGPSAPRMWITELELTKIVGAS